MSERYTFWVLQCISYNVYLSSHITRHRKNSPLKGYQYWSACQLKAISEISKNLSRFCLFSSNVGSSLDTSVINSYKAEQPTPNLVPRPFARGQDKMAGHPLSSLTIKLINTLVFYILPVKTGNFSLKHVLVNWYFIIMWPLLYLHAAWLSF